MALEALDLVWVHLFADLEEQVGVCFLQFRARLGDAIDLRIERRFVGGCGAGKLLHLRLCLLQAFDARDQQVPILFKDRVHPGLLVRAQLQILHIAVVVPPALSWWA